MRKRFVDVSCGDLSALCHFQDFPITFPVHFTESINDGNRSVRHHIQSFRVGASFCENLSENRGKLRDFFPGSGGCVAEAFQQTLDIPRRDTECEQRFPGLNDLLIRKGGEICKLVEFSEHRVAFFRIAEHRLETHARHFETRAELLNFHADSGDSGSGGRQSDQPGKIDSLQAGRFDDDIVQPGVDAAEPARRLRDFRTEAYDETGDCHFFNSIVFLYSSRIARLTSSNSSLNSGSGRLTDFPRSIRISSRYAVARSQRIASTSRSLQCRFVMRP